ncbi:MAG: ribonuclease E activity regulator RraA [Pseudomonadota bacterium]
MTGPIRFFPTADLSDAFPDAVRQVMLPFRDFGGRRRFAGRIRTAVTVEDTKLVKKALFNAPGDGDVIVLDGGGSLRTALLGDRMAERLLSNGWAGIVINGAVRDSGAISKLDIGVKALGTSPVRPRQAGIGALDVPVAFGNAIAMTGEVVYCDEDGVIVASAALNLK